MDRTKAIDNVSVRPAPSGSTHAAGYFDDGTTVEAEWMNGVQEALIVPLEDGGITPDTDDYEQFATLLSGVHGIVTDVRSDLATTGASTTSKRTASAAIGAIADGDCSQCNAGANQRAHGAYSQCNAGVSQTADGDYSQCNAGLNQAANRDYSQCNAGAFQTADGVFSQCNAGEHQHNSGGKAAVTSGQYYELIDDNCWASGYGTSAPANHGDGLTNKNLSHYLNAQTGEARHKGTVNIGGNVDAGTGATIVLDGATGDVTVGGEIKGAGTDPLAIGSSVEVLFEDETASVDWATSAADHEALSPLVTYTDAPVVEITVTVANSDSSTHDIEMGSSLLLDINALNSGFTRTLIGAVAETTAGSTNPQKGLRWSCGLIKNSAGVTKLAVTSVGKTTATIAASGADTITVKVRLQYAKLTAI